MGILPGERGLAAPLRRAQQTPLARQRRAWIDLCPLGLRRSGLAVPRLFFQRLLAPEGVEATKASRIVRRAPASLEAAVPADQPLATRPSPFSPLRHGTFRAVWVANLISNFGGLIQSAGAAWLMTSLTGSAGLVALVQASTTLPIMLFSLAAGAIADNYDKRGVMLVAQVFLLAVSTLLAICAYLGLITPWSLLAFTFLIGCGTALNNPAWQSSVRDMVPRHDLPQAIALNSVGINIARSVGPALGGHDRRRGGRGGRLRRERRQLPRPDRRPPSLAAADSQARPLPPEPLGAAMGAGVRFVAMSPTIRTVLFRALRVRARRQRGPGAHAPCRARPRRGRSGHVRPAARRVRPRRRRRRTVRAAASVRHVAPRGLSACPSLASRPALSRPPSAPASP